MGGGQDDSQVRTPKKQRAGGGGLGQSECKGRDPRVGESGWGALTRQPQLTSCSLPCRVSGTCSPCPKSPPSWKSLPHTAHPAGVRAPWAPPWSASVGAKGEWGLCPRPSSTPSLWAHASSVHPPSAKTPWKSSVCLGLDQDPASNQGPFQPPPPGAPCMAERGP